MRCFLNRFLPSAATYTPRTYIAANRTNPIKFLWLCALFSSIVMPGIAQATDDLLVADFEQATYGNWKVTGNAFGNAPAKGTLPGQMQVDGFQGQGLVNSFIDGDDSVGSLTSPEFTIERPYIAFLIGGGKNPEKLALQLLVENKIVRSATGPNDTPGGTEKLEPQSWDVREFIGKNATLRIIDEAKGSWGHINVDHIVQTEVKPKGYLTNIEREVIASARFLHFPIKNGAAKRSVTLLVDGQVLVRNDIELADQEPDWWAPMDISSWSGKKLTVRVDKLHEDSKALQQIDVQPTLKDAQALYREDARGQFHFSPKRGWNNDPNGCVYYNGEYHLFFQHNPYGWGWGNMHWGHAVSKDLVHWEELGDKLLPDSMGPMFSGSAVVDWNNTSGFGTESKPPLVLIYTAAGNPTVQGIAYSTDGRNFTKYSENPVLPQITPGNRDPKVFWHQATKNWVMVLYVEWKSKHTVHFFTSSNLKEWELASISNGDAPGGGFLFECPDFFPLKIDDQSDRTKWVLLGANSEYAVGDFDGKKFTPDATRMRGHRGKGFYAAQSFSDEPKGRRVLIGWWQTETKGSPFNQSMTLPLELGLRQTDDGPRMTFQPVQELQALRAKTHRISIGEIAPGDKNPLDEIESDLLEIQVEFDVSQANEIVLNVRDVMVEYNCAKQELSVAGQRVAAPAVGGKQRLRIYCDRTGVEVFASEGLCYVPMPYNTRIENKKSFFEVRGGTAMIESLVVHELQSAWEQPAATQR